MRLFVIGDHTGDDPTVKNEVYKTLDYLFKEYDTEFILSFDEEGVDDISITWAYDNNIKFDMYEAKKSTYPLNKNCHPNKYLRGIVDDYKIDAFLFFFLENTVKDKDKSEHRQVIRNFYNRTTKHFKRQIVFTTHEIPPK